MADEQTLRTVLDETARRRATLAWRQGWTLGGVVAAGALIALRIAAAVLAPTGALLVALVVVAVGIAVAALIVALRGARIASTPTQLARLLEERHGGLDDVVASAVDYAARADHRPEVARRLDVAALRALGDAPVDAVVAPVALASAGRRALAATAALLVALAIAAAPLTRALEIAAVSLVPSRLALTVEPGDVRVRAGRPVTIRARVRGTAALVPSLVTGQGADATPLEMSPTADGSFEIIVPEVTATFGYHVVAGVRRSDTYTVTAVHPARVERIDLDYAYPPALRLEPRHEDDGGDIYAPEGTAVSLRITADRAVGASALLLADGTRLPLGVAGRVASGGLTITADGSYRIAFVDDDGVEMPDDTEYFIRTLLDRPPDVRVLRPAGDKQVTPLEEVAIEARADDDFGVQAFELVLQKPGDAEVVVPLARGQSGLTANGAHTLYLEDLEVAPGDIVSYYVRARDIGRGKPSSESRSDIYFLEVKAFNDEFVAAQSQAMAAGGQAQGVQDLAAAQKEIVVATWKLDSRGRRAGGRSAADIKVVADAQRALEQRAGKEAGSQLQAAGNATSGRRRRGQATLNTVEDDPLGLAIDSMRKAIVELDARRTSAALPHEMQALDHLLRAESDVQRRQVARQQQGGGGNGNREAPDLSALFDQELRKQQQTNYETPASSETRQDAREDDDPLARLRELARRQEALSREQQDLARQQAGLDAETVKRRLERLSRDQEALRKQLEELARQLPEQRQDGQDERSAERQSASGQSQQSRAENGQGQRSQAGQQASGSRSGSTSGQPGQSGQSPSGGASSDRDAVSEALAEMRQATSGLREQDAERASQNAGRALERMRQAEESLRGSTDDDLRRRLGDLQLEARQLADAQRRLTDEQRRNDAVSGSAQGRQLAGEQQRLAERAERLRQRMRSLSQQARGGDGRAALDQAGREMESSRVADLMRQAARTLERPADAGQDRAGETTAERRPGEAAPGTVDGAQRPAGQDRAAATGTTRPAAGGTSDAVRLGADAARALDRVAERLDGRRTADAASSTRLSDDLSRTRDLRDRLEAVEQSLDQLRAREGELRERASAAGPQAADREGPQPGQAGQPGQPGRDGRGSSNGDREVSRLQRQLAEDMRQARAQVDALGRTSPDMRGPSTPESWQPSVSAPGTEAFKQDFARWESLKQNLLLALEKVERGLADELRQQETRDRLNAGASDAVPDDYRKMIDRYYRSLATPRRPER